jgi:hypothetical protein
MDLGANGTDSVDGLELAHNHCHRVRELTYGFVFLVELSLLFGDLLVAGRHFGDHVGELGPPNVDLLRKVRDLRAEGGGLFLRLFCSGQRGARFSRSFNAVGGGALLGYIALIGLEALARAGEAGVAFHHLGLQRVLLFCLGAQAGRRHLPRQIGLRELQQLE